MLRRYAALITLILPSSLAAQVPAASANPITAVFHTRTLTLQRNLAQAFDSIPEARVAQQVTLTSNGASRQMTRANLVVGRVIDMADHYSQIANYMRLNHLIPPTALPRPAHP